MPEAGRIVRTVIDELEVGDTFWWNERDMYTDPAVVCRSMTTTKDSHGVVVRYVVNEHIAVDPHTPIIIRFQR